MNIITPLFSFVMVVAMIVSIGCQTLGSIVIATLRGVVFIGIGMLILPTFFRRTRHLANSCTFGSAHFDSKYISRSKIGSV
ncbi:hypothetical protein [Capnocytophaga gingivalis]